MLESLLNSMFEYKSREMYTALPAVVVSVHNNLSTLTIDAQPAVNVREPDSENVIPRPVIQNIPVQMPSSSTSAFTYPVNVGDSVLLVFCMDGIDSWKRGDGRSSTPSDYRHHSIRDCFAITGIHTMSGSVNNPSKRVWAHNTKDAVITHNIGRGNETEVRLLASGGVVINTNQSATINCKEANINSTTMNVNVPNTNWNGDIKHTGVIDNSGTIKSNDVTVTNHTHNYGVPPDKGT